MSNVDRLVEEVLERTPKKVLIQAPEGLRTKLQEIEERLGERGVNSVASLEPCYGACDIKDQEAKMLGCDLLVHVGHTKFLKSETVETLYFPWYYDVDPEGILEEEMGKLDGFRRIGLLTSINFYPAFKTTKKVLKKHGKEVITSSGERTKEGQILGCDVGAGLDIKEEVDCFLYVGSGEFHPLGLALKTDKPVYILDFEKEEIHESDFDRFRRQKIAAIERGRKGKKFGILVSTKTGQCNPQTANEIKAELEGKGKKAWTFSMDEISPEKLEGIDVDVWISTACPRIAVEQRTDFKKPILNPDEAEKLLQKL